MRRCALVCLVTTACFSWNQVDHEAERGPLYRYRLAMRDDLISGRATLRLDGTVEFALALDHACTLIPQVAVHNYITYERHLSTIGSVPAILGTAALLVAGFGALERHPPKWTGWTAGGGALAIGATIPIAMAAPRSVTRETFDPRPLDGPDTSPASCRGIDPIAELGDLELITPWGVRVVAPIERDGVARFTIDWAVAPQNQFRLAAAWTVIAMKRRVSGTWRFADLDVTRMLVIAGARAYGGSVR